MNLQNSDLKERLDFFKKIINLALKIKLNKYPLPHGRVPLDIFSVFHKIIYLIYLIQFNACFLAIKFKQGKPPNS